MLEAKMLCRTCGAEFVVGLQALIDRGTRYMPLSCPACKDRSQRRPCIATHTECVRFWPAVLIQSLPGDWERFKADEAYGDHWDWRIVVRGARFGASWDGRIDLRAPFRAFPNAPAPGDVVSVREMIGTRECRVVRAPRETRHGTFLHSHYISVHSTDAEIAAAEEQFGGKAEKIAEQRRWVALGSPEAETPDRVLLWAVAHSKSTLKGYGRQYAAGLTLDAAEAAWMVHGSCRTGRASTEAALVIIPFGAPVTRWHEEGGHRDLTDLITVTPPACGPVDDVFQEAPDAH